MGAFAQALAANRGGRGAVRLRVKDLFFDRPKVVRAIGRANVRVLSRIGAFTRTRARSSIRRRKGISQPGNPPHSHVGLLKELLFFAYDERSESVVIGPVNTKRDRNVPRLLELGGVVRARRDLYVERRGTQGRDTSRRFTKDKIVCIPRGTRMAYKPRPYMGPALAAERPRIPKRWRNAVREV